MNKQKGIAPIAIILIIIGVLIFGGGGYYAVKKFQKPAIRACTEEAKQCPDGSYVSRTGPNCEFAECPEAKETSTEKQSGYIKSVYEKDRKRYLDINYIQTLRGKEAAIKGIEIGRCQVAGKTKEDLLKEINLLNSNNLELEDKIFIILPTCFPNGVWLDINENPKIRTFEIVENALIKFAYAYDFCDVSGSYGPYSVTYEIFEKCINKKEEVDEGRHIVSYPFKTIPFEITIKDNQVTEVSEIYRP